MNNEVKTIYVATQEEADKIPFKDGQIIKVGEAPKEEKKAAPKAKAKKEKAANQPKVADFKVTRGKVEPKFNANSIRSQLYSVVPAKGVNFSTVVKKMSEKGFDEKKTKQALQYLRRSNILN